MNASVEPLVIDQTTQPEVVERAFAANDYLDPSAYVLSNSLSEKDLLCIIERHQGYAHWLPLLEFVAAHAAAGEAVHNRILSVTDDQAVLDTIATSGRATKVTLETLKASKWKSVREHAWFALLNLQLNSSSEAQFRDICRSHSGPSLFDASVRAYLAAHPRVPVSLLDELSEDPVNFVRETAGQTARRRRSAQK